MVLHWRTKQMTNARAANTYRANKVSPRTQAHIDRRVAKNVAKLAMAQEFFDEMNARVVAERTERLKAGLAAKRAQRQLIEQVQSVEQVIDNAAAEAEAAERARKDRKNELARKRRAAAKAAAQLVEA